MLSEPILTVHAIDLVACRLGKRGWWSCTACNQWNVQTRRKYLREEMLAHRNEGCRYAQFRYVRKQPVGIGGT